MTLDIQHRIRAIMPELKVETLELNQDGLINDVAIVNGELVFRFPKTERFAQILATELAILDFIRPHLSLEIPTPIYRETAAVVYPFVKGRPLLHLDLERMTSLEREAIAADLGRFLHELHTAPLNAFEGQLPQTPAPVTRERRIDLQKRAQAQVYPLLLPHQIEWADRLFDQALSDPLFFEFEPVLIHADLAPYHILVDPQTDRISGVIDFGTAGLGDPALDFGNLMQAYGEPFIRLMGKAYPDLDQLLDRARFYARSIELQWVVRGLESGETFWFTAHLGGAR